jgi:hypothetical protein
MRLWSLHPSYLDRIGLIACWREGLLARKVLQGETRGYRNHPQLLRFKNQVDPVGVIDQYLSAVYAEAIQRSFNFNSKKIRLQDPMPLITVTDGQLEYELCHLKAKLIKRDVDRYARLCLVISPQPNPIFRVVPGKVEVWEKVPGKT